jgi:toxin ParE1/3/4
MKHYEVQYSNGSHEDLAELATYILERSSEQRAISYIRKLVRECRSLSTAPYRGSRRSDIRPNMRVIGYKKAVLMVFRIEEVSSVVVILGFAYRGRSIDQILARDE